MKIKKLSQILVLCSVFLLVLFQSGNLQTGKADFGNFSSYDSSGSDWGSSSDWSSSDWSYSDYSSGYSDYGSSSGSVAFPFGVVFPIFVIIVILIIVFSRKNRPQTGHMSGSVPTRPATVVLPNRTPEISSIIAIQDPAFSSGDFLTFAKYVFVQIQDAWSKRDLTPVAGVMHQNLYQTTNLQVQRKITDGIVNHIERISVTNAYLTSYRRDERFEYLAVFLAAQMIDYQVKEATGQIVAGNRANLWQNRYKMVFLRTIGTKTEDTAKEYDLSLHCPSCGAPVQGTCFGVCDYCGSTVTNNLYTWVLSDMSPVRDTTTDEGIMK